MNHNNVQQTRETGAHGGKGRIRRTASGGERGTIDASRAEGGQPRAIVGGKQGAGQNMRQYKAWRCGPDEVERSQIRSIPTANQESIWLRDA